MRARVLRALLLLFFAVMLAAYAVSIATGASPEGAHDNLQVVFEQWC